MPRNYNYNNQSSVIRTEEFDFKIEISNPEMDFMKIKSRIYNSLNKKGKIKFEENYPFIKSPIEDFISKKIARLNKDEECIVFMTNYREREGSFVIAFSIYVFTTIMNYGQLVDSLNSLKRDFEYFFQDEFSKNTQVEVDYTNRTNKVFEKAEIIIRKSIISEIGKEFKKLKLIVLTIGILAGGLSLFAIFKTLEKESVGQPPIQREIIRDEIRNEMNAIETKDKINQIYQILMEEKKDSDKK